jgi:hypothetical protein
MSLTSKLCVVDRSMPPSPAEPLGSCIFDCTLTTMVAPFSQSPESASFAPPRLALTDCAMAFHVAASPPDWESTRTPVTRPPGPSVTWIAARAFEGTSAAYTAPFTTEATEPAAGSCSPSFLSRSRRSLASSLLATSRSARGALGAWVAAGAAASADGASMPGWAQTWTLCARCLGEPSRSKKARSSRSGLQANQARVT